MPRKLAGELLDDPEIVGLPSKSAKKKRNAPLEEANKAFAHYRW